MKGVFIFLSLWLWVGVAQANSLSIEDEMTGGAREWKDPHWIEKFPNLSEDLPITEQAIGFYADGRLANATELALEGEGYVKLFRPRHRQFGTSLLIETLTQVAAQIKQQFGQGERLQIGDISAQKGGSISRHASHQNGLDIDIAYYRINGKEQDPNSTNGFDEVFVRSGKLSLNFDIERNWHLVVSLVSSGRINRIFVDGLIKQTFCRWSNKASLPGREEILRRLRPYPHHADHMHVRFYCPSSSPRCREQADPPMGSGC